MEALVERGLVRHIGVSNFGMSDLEELMEGNVQYRLSLINLKIMYIYLKMICTDTYRLGSRYCLMFYLLH